MQTQGNRGAPAIQPRTGTVIQPRNGAGGLPPGHPAHSGVGASLSARPPAIGGAPTAINYDPFQEATRATEFLKLLLTGPSGAGKTFSALKIALGLMQARGQEYRIAVLDTENGSAALYSDRPDMPKFKIVKLEPPYTTERYLQYMVAAERYGYDVLITDSLSHQWAGDGGILNRKEQKDSRPGSNHFANWAEFTPEHERFKAAILQLKIHLICTARSKQEWILSENSKGKQAPQKVGLAPVQRDGMEYEFTSVLDMDLQNMAQASKDRTSLFVGHRFKPSEVTGRALWAWLQGGNSKAVKESSPTAAQIDTAWRDPEDDIPASLDRLPPPDAQADFNTESRVPEAAQPGPSATAATPAQPAAAGSAPGTGQPAARATAATAARPAASPPGNLGTDYLKTLSGKARVDRVNAALRKLDPINPWTLDEATDYVRQRWGLPRIMAVNSAQYVDLIEEIEAVTYETALRRLAEGVVARQGELLPGGGR